MKTEALVKPNPYRYFGPIKDVDWRQLDRDLRFDILPVPDEIAHSELRLRQIDDISSAVLSYIRDHLNLDLSDRVPPYHKFHYFTVSQFNKLFNENDGVSETDPQPTSGYKEVTGGLSEPGGQIFIPEFDETMALLCTEHELLHVLSHHSIKVLEKADIEGNTDTEIFIDPHQVGFQNTTNTSLLIIDEVLNEMTNLQIFDHSWKAYPTLGHIKYPTFTGYTYAMAVFDELIYKFAAAKRRTPDDVFRNLLIGKFVGQMGPLRELTRFIGTDTMKFLAHLGTSPEEAIKLSRRLDLPEAEKCILNLLDGLDVPFISEYFYH